MQLIGRSSIICASFLLFKSCWRDFMGKDHQAPFTISKTQKVHLYDNASRLRSDEDCCYIRFDQRENL